MAKDRDIRSAQTVRLPQAPPEPQPGHADVDRVTEPLACIGCGVNLKGEPSDGLCPRCERPVRDSLRGDFLLFSSPSVVSRLAEAIDVALMGTLLLMALAAVAVLSTFVVGLTHYTLIRSLEDAYDISVVLAAVMPLVSLCATLLLILRDPFREPALAQRTAARMRQLLIYAIAGVVLQIGGGALWLPFPMLAGLWLWLIVPQVLLSLRLERTMLRVPNMQMALQTRRLRRIGLVYSALLGANLIAARLSVSEALSGPVLALMVLTLLCGLTLGALIARLLLNARLVLRSALRESQRNERLVQDFAARLDDA